MSKIIKKVTDFADKIDEKLNPMHGDIGKYIDPLHKFSKQVFHGVKTAFRKVWDNPVGKVVIMAVAIYFGGAAFGLWDSAVPAVNGAFVGGAAEAGVAGAGGEAALAGGAAADTVAAGGAAAGGAAGGAAAGGTAGVAAVPTSEALIGGALEGGFGATAAEAGGFVGASAGAGAGATEVAATGIMGKAIAGVKSIGALVAENKLATAMIMGGLASAMQPDPYAAQAEAYDDYLKRLNANTAVGDIDLGIHSARPRRRAQESAPAPAEPPPSVVAPMTVKAPAPQAPGAPAPVTPSYTPTPAQPPTPQAPQPQQAARDAQPLPVGAPPGVAPQTPDRPAAVGLVGSRLAVPTPGWRTA